MTTKAFPIHGGPDALGVPAHDLSTNANACGPYPAALQALREVDARHYPDPAYTALTVQLATWHGVAPSRIVMAASGSEFIQRISVAVALQAQADGTARPGVWLPAHAYGDYARAAQGAGLACVDAPAEALLLWACEPSSPLGQVHAGLAAQVTALRAAQVLVLDQAYEPLRLSGAPSLDAAALDRVWRLVTPNKALGLTGVRAAYAIAPLAAPSELVARLRALAPSWPVGSHGVALLQCWASVAAHDWLGGCRAQLSRWKARQIELLQSAGWQVQPSDANFLVAACADWAGAGGRLNIQNTLTSLRAQGIKLRDCASFGLPGQLRMAVVPPTVQDALMTALRSTARQEQPA